MILEQSIQRFLSLPWVTGPAWRQCHCIHSVFPGSQLHPKPELGPRESKPVKTGLCTVSCGESGGEGWVFLTQEEAGRGPRLLRGCWWCGR